MNSDTIKDVVLFRVSAKSNIHKVSEAIYKTYLEGSKIEIQAIGGGAVNQAVKAVAISRSKLALAGKDTAVIVGFRDVPNSRQEEDGSTISAINFTVVEAYGKR